jgi:hypothetical protein
METWSEAFGFSVFCVCVAAVIITVIKELR